MNKNSFLTPQSSKTIEELLNDTGTPHHQNWLLSYLDVFVLMVMLIITLLSLGDLKIEEENRKNTAIKAAAAGPIRPPVRKSRPISVSAPAPAPVSQLQPVIPPLEPEPIPVLPIETTDNTVSAPAPLPAPVKEIPVEAHLDETETTTPQQQPSPPTKREVLENSLSEQLGRLGLDQTVAIKITEDYAQLEIQDKILFESSQASLTGSGEALLKGLAPLLNQATGLIFIEGHTDNRPIKTPQFPSNWELGSARATSVLHYLATQGLDSSRLRAMTYADTMPIADNSTPEGREKNRRVSILIKAEE